MGVRKGTDERQRRDPCGAVMGPADGLAVQGHDLALQGSGHRLDPAQETGFQWLRIPHGQDPATGVVRGKAMGQVQTRRQLRPFALPKQRNVHPGVCSTDDAEDSDEEDGG